MGVSKNGGTPKSSILIGFFIINHEFWGTPIFGNIQMEKRVVYLFVYWFASSVGGSFVAFSIWNDSTWYLL